MSKRVLRVITILLLAIVLVAGFVAPSFALKNVDIGAYEKADYSTGNKASTSAKKIVGSLIDVFQVVGVGVAIIMLVMLAIKYLSAAPNEKAEIKKSVSIYVLGAVLLFAASGVLEIVQQFAANVKASEG